MNEILNIFGNIDSMKKADHILEIPEIGDCLIFVSRIIACNLG